MSLTYYYGDVRTGEVLGDLPFTDVKLTWALSDAGTFSGKLKVSDPEVQARGVFSIGEGRTSILADYDGQLIWAGIMWSQTYDSASQTLNVAAADYWTYVRRRIVLNKLVVNSYDVSSAVVAIMGVALDGNAPGGLRRVNQAAAGWSGPYNPYKATYLPADQKTVSELIEEIAGYPRGQGIDFRQDTSWASFEQPDVIIRVGRPWLGRTVDVTGARFEFPGNIMQYTLQSDGSKMTNQVFGKGEEDGKKAAPTKIVSFDDKLSLYPRLQTILSVDSKIQSVVDAKTQAYGNLYRNPRRNYSVTVRADIDPWVRSYQVGDDIELYIDDSYHQGGQLITQRIAQIEYTPATETVVITPWEEPDGTS